MTKKTEVDRLAALLDAYTEDMRRCVESRIDERITSLFSQNPPGYGPFHVGAPEKPIRWAVSVGELLLVWHWFDTEKEAVAFAEQHSGTIWRLEYWGNA